MNLDRRTHHACRRSGFDAPVKLHQTLIKWHVLFHCLAFISSLGKHKGAVRVSSQVDQPSTVLLIVLDNMHGSTTNEVNIGFSLIVKTERTALSSKDVAVETFSLVLVKRIIRLLYYD